MKCGAHPFPFAALSIPYMKNVPIHCWVDSESFPVVAYDLHTNFALLIQVALTSRQRSFSAYEKNQKVRYICVLNVFFKPAFVKTYLFVMLSDQTYYSFWCREWLMEYDYIANNCILVLFIIVTLHSTCSTCLKYS